MPIERLRPPTTADEATTLAAWLDFYRETLALKCDGLTVQQLRTAAAPPPDLTLLVLVQHMTEVERTGCRRTLPGAPVPAVSPAPAERGHGARYAPRDDVSAEQAMAAWREEIAVSTRNCRGRSLDDTAPFHGMDVSLRWIYTHMIAEYARHDGHADLLRERIDGTTGV